MDVDYDPRDKQVDVFVVDNDPVVQTVPVVGPGVAISALAAVHEGCSASFTVRLNAPPTANVTIDVSSDNAAVTVAPMTLAFTMDDYATEQTVTVMAAEDDDSVHIPGVMISLAVSSMDMDYDGSRRDCGGLRRRQRSRGSESRGSSARCRGSCRSARLPPWSKATSDSFTVSLSVAPTAEATIDISSDNAAVTVAPMSLTFTADNYAHAAERDGDGRPGRHDSEHGSAALSLDGVLHGRGLRRSRAGRWRRSSSPTTIPWFERVEVPGPTVTETVTRTVTRTVTVPAAPAAPAAAPGVIGSTSFGHGD